MKKLEATEATHIVLGKNEAGYVLTLDDGKKAMYYKMSDEDGKAWFKAFNKEG